MKKLKIKIVSLLVSSAMLTSICASAAEPEPYYLVSGQRWSDGKAVMYFEDLSSSMNNQANYAASDWNSQLQNYFSFRKTSTNKDNAVTYAPLSGTSQNALAITSPWIYSLDSSGWYPIAKAPVTINNKYQWDTSSNSCASNKYHLRSTLRHEFGHVLGLEHSGISSACMYPTMGPGEILPLTSDDINGAKSIYRDLARSATESELSENVDGLAKAEVCILYPDYTSIDLAGKAENVIVGTVKNIEPGYSSEGNVYSKVDITVTEDLKGNTENQTVSIPMFGGSKDGIAYSYDGAPTYEVGEEVVLYLTNINSDIATYNISDESVWYLPLTYQGAISLSRNALSESASDIIEQVKKDIIDAENTVSVSEEETTTVGEPVEDIMLEEI